MQYEDIVEEQDYLFRPFGLMRNIPVHVIKKSIDISEQPLEERVEVELLENDPVWGAKGQHFAVSPVFLFPKTGHAH